MPDEATPTRKGLNTPFHDAAATAALKAMAEIEKNWEGALSGQDVEAIHDLRVGTRRLRAALSVYEAAFPVREFRRVERAMSVLTDALGPARDTDVLIEHLKSVQEGLTEQRAAESVGIQAYVDYLQECRARQQTALDRAMQKLDIHQVSADLQSASAPQD